ncbi:MAG: ABC-F family ATP-binding cassette domain-containing protein [Firmicutes bacterium]|nr:ABC-F family ATP-binding cassette domain-containing protein [Bacillota bacterium]
MAILALNKLSLAFLEKVVLEDCSLSLEAKTKCGLVGVNGAGKTSLFRLLTGELTPTGGEIITPKGLKIGIMEQELKNHHNTMQQELLSLFAPLQDLERRQEEVNHRLQAADFADEAEQHRLLNEQFNLHEAYIAQGGLTYQSRIKSTLLGLGFTPQDFDRPLSQLSGGQRSKLALAKLLLSDADLLLLDEPTNHLDITSLEWLEDFLHNLPTAFIVISHDRFFLDRVTDHTIHLQNHRLKLYKGNFSAYKQQYTAELESTLRHNANVQHEISRVESIIKQQKQWNREKNLVTAHSKEKQVQRLQSQLQAVELQPTELIFNFASAPAAGNDLLTLTELGHAFGEHELFRNLNFQLHRGDKVFLLGANGAGKTTIFRLIMQQFAPNSGSITHGAGLKIGYFDQVQKLEYTNETLLEYLRNIYPKMTETQLRSALAAFLFYSEDIEKPCSVLSGGEKARLGLLKILLSQPNLLLLDEPTNHLDIAGREALEAALANFDGAILAISHDRYFINALAEKIIVLENAGLTEFCGNYAYYLEKRQQLNLPAAAIENNRPPKAASDNKLAYQAQKEQAANLRRLQTRLQKLEDAINKHEAKIAELEELLASPEVATDYQQAAAIDQQAAAERELLNDAMQAWEDTAIAIEEAESAN